jgi:tetratricopeptide (TPR) repeat protein
LHFFGRGDSGLAINEREAGNVIDRLSKIIVGILAVGVLVTGAWAQAPAAAPGAAAAPAGKQPAVKDQGEFDLATAAQKEKDPAKQMELLKQWEQKYADSDFKGNRAVMMAQADSGIAAKAMQPGASPADLDAGSKAAQDLVDKLDKYLAPENKPAGVADDKWKEARTATELQAHTLLGNIAMAKKTPADDAVAEKEFKKLLELAPGSAPTAYSLGTLILRERKVERFPEALFYIARAVEITGPTALSPADKQKFDAYLKKAYDVYHGDDSGLADVKKAAASSPTMPADFKIESVTDIAKKQEGDQAAFAAANPDIALWRQIHDALKAPDGNTYFGQVKDSAIPPADGAFKMFRAKVVSQPSPKELLVNVDNLAGDATLKFENPLKGTIEPGTPLKFKGVVESFVPEPYMLTLAVEKEDIEGLPATVFAPATAPRRRAAPKKK